MKYPQLSKMPYYNTNVPVEKTMGEIILLLEKYGIQDHQWTTFQGQETLKFIFEMQTQEKELKLLVQMDIPQLKAWKRSQGEIVFVPRNQVFRLFYYSLKGLLESTKYNIMKKEEIFFSYIYIQLPTGQTKRIRDVLEEKQLFLPQNMERLE